MIALLIISIPSALLLGIVIGLWINRDRGETIVIIDLSKADEVPVILNKIETINVNPILN